MKNLLVTGGAGFIGSNFIHYVLEQEPDVHIVNLDILTYAGNMDNLKGLPEDRLWTVIGDICHEAALNHIWDMHPIDTIVHFAAETHVDRSIDAPGQFMQTNVMGAFNLLEWARKHNTRFHHISTDEVYGSLSPSEAPWTEDSPYAPNSPYSASKAASDHLVRVYGHTYGLEYTITNCSNNYGPRQHPEKLIPLTITNALKGKPIPVYGDGLQIRDWLYVDDHCEAIWLVLEKGTMGETYNIGGDNQITNLAMVNLICDILNELVPKKCSYRELIGHVKDRPGHDRRYAMDSTKLREALGQRQKESLRGGLIRTINWYIERAGK